MTNPLPPQASWLSPYLMVIDVDKAVAFYQQAFGFQLKNLVPGKDEVSMHAELNYQGQLIMCGREGAYSPEPKSPRSSGIECPITLYVYTENVDEFYQSALANGAVSVSAPEDMFWGDRMCRLKDPDDYIWSFATYRGEGHKKQ